MRHFRFSILQLFLAATLVALVLGLVTSAWRATQYQAIEQICFSPCGSHLAARYSGGGVAVWRLDQGSPKLVARTSGKLGLLSYDFGSIHFVAEDKLLKAEVPVGSVGGGITIRTLDLQTRQFEKPIRIDFPGLTASVQTATGKRLVLSDWSSSSVSSFRLDTGKLEQQWPLNSPPLGYSALAASGKTLAVCDQAGQVSVIDIESDQPPVRLAGYWPIAVSKDGRLVATGSVQKPGQVRLYDTTTAASPVELQFALSMLRALAITPDGGRLLATDGIKVECYDVAKQDYLPAIEVDDSGRRYVASCVISPAGDRLATNTPSQITICDLSGGKARRLGMGGGMHFLEIAIYTLAFAAWSVVWGIVAKRERLRCPRSTQAALPPALQPAGLRPVPTLFSSRMQFVWLGTTIVSLMVIWSIMEGVGGQSFLAGAWLALGMTVEAGIPAVAIFIAFMSITHLIKGPHYLTLRRLQQLAHDVGRIQRIGRLTFWFAGRSRIAGNISRHLDMILDNAETVFTRPVEFKRRRLIACFDRQCDQDAFFGRHVPLPASIPRTWTGCLGLVCEEAAVMQLVPPQQALRSVLAFSILSEQKRGYLAGWAAAILTQQLTRDERRPAELRAAIRRLKVLMIRYPQWDPKAVFFQSARERFELLLAHEQRPAWLEACAEADLLLTLGEMLLGPSAPVELRHRTLAWLRAVTPKDDPLTTFARDVGLTLDDLLTQWRAWLAGQSGLPYDRLPNENGWLLRDVAFPILADEKLPVAMRERMTRELGSFSIAGAPALIGLLAHPKIELRREAAHALEYLSGEVFGDDLTRWQAWWESIDPAIRGDGAPLGRMVDAAAFSHPADADVLDAAPTSVAPTDPSAPPSELKICWGLMLVCGLNALLIPIALIFLIGPVMHPMLYYSLFVGVAAIVSAVTRETRRVGMIAKLQVMNAMACDPINLCAGWIEQMLLRRPHVQRYLAEVNAVRA